MATQHFFYVDQAGFRPLRPATEAEQQWYVALGQELHPYQVNVDRFDRVHESFCELETLFQAPNPNAYQLERKAKSAVANFLYSFNEFLDQWKTHLIRTYGERSDYFLHFKKLTQNAFDTYDSYKITYALRNFQHVDAVVDGVSAWLGEPVKVYASKTRLLSSNSFTRPQRLALSNLPDRFELFPIFKEAKGALEEVQKRVIFYAVTRDQESRAIEALRFKETLCGTGGTLLLGRLLQENGEPIEPTDAALEKLSQNNANVKFDYCEMPWGICNLLKLFQGTDYKAI